jgi:hypothetical protein
MSLLKISDPKIDVGKKLSGKVLHDSAVITVVVEIKTCTFSIFLEKEITSSFYE